MRLADHFYGLGVKRIHLLINSLGGDVFAGPAAFNHFRMLGLEVLTYNVATVQSIAVPLFCAGTKRYCVPNATFMIHPVQWQAKQEQVSTARQLREAADFCDTNSKIIVDIIAAEIGKDADLVRADMERTTYFNAEQSLAYGLVHKIVPANFFPAATSYSVVEEDGVIRDVNVPQRIAPEIDALLRSSFPGFSASPPPAPIKGNKSA